MELHAVDIILLEDSGVGHGVGAGGGRFGRDWHVIAMGEIDVRARWQAGEKLAGLNRVQRVPAHVGYTGVEGEALDVSLKDAQTVQFGSFGARLIEALQA